MDITVCTKEELAQAVLELTVELGKTRRALNAALEVAKMETKVKDKPAYPYKAYQTPCASVNEQAHVATTNNIQTVFHNVLPTLDPMAIDPRSVV